MVSAMSSPSTAALGDAAADRSSRYPQRKRSSTPVDVATETARYPSREGQADFMIQYNKKNRPDSTGPKQIETVEKKMSNNELQCQNERLQGAMQEALEMLEKFASLVKKLEARLRDRDGEVGDSADGINQVMDVDDVDDSEGADAQPAPPRNSIPVLVGTFGLRAGDLPPSSQGRAKKGAEALREDKELGRFSGSAIFDESDDEDEERQESERRRKLGSYLHNHHPLLASLRLCLYTLASGDRDRIAVLYSKFVADPFMNGVAQSSLDTDIVDSISSFLQSEHMQAAGSRTSSIRRLMHDALTVAVSPDAISARKISAQSRRFFGNASRAHRSLLRSSCLRKLNFLGTGFLTPICRAPRKNKVDVSWIFDCTHDPTISQLNTFSRRRFKVVYPDGTVEWHGEHAMVCKSKWDAALNLKKLPRYRQWQEENKRGDGTLPELSTQFIRDNLCGCFVCILTFRECADKIKTAHREYVHGWNAIRRAAKAEQAVCNCGACEPRRAAEALAAVKTVAARQKASNSSAELPDDFEGAVSSLLGRSDWASDVKAAEVQAAWQAARPAEEKKEAATAKAQELAAAIKYEELVARERSVAAEAALKSNKGNEELQRAAEAAARAAKKTTDSSSFVAKFTSAHGTEVTRSGILSIDDIKDAWEGTAATSDALAAAACLKSAAASKIAGFFSRKSELRRDGEAGADSFELASKGPEEYSDHFLCKEEEQPDLDVSSEVQGHHLRAPMMRNKSCSCGSCGSCGVAKSIQLTVNSKGSLQSSGLHFSAGTTWVHSVSAGSAAAGVSIPTTKCFLGKVAAAQVFTEAGAKQQVAALKKTKCKTITLAFYVLSERFKICPHEWNESPVKFREYVMMPRSSGAVARAEEAGGGADPEAAATSGERMQSELVLVEAPRRHLMKKLAMGSPVAFAHDWHCKWSRTGRQNVTLTFPGTSIAVATDFAAQQELKGNDSVTCATYLHTNKAIFVVLSNPRVVNGKRIHDCDCWTFFIPAATKYKEVSAICLFWFWHRLSTEWGLTFFVLLPMKINRTISLHTMHVWM